VVGVVFFTCVVVGAVFEIVVVGCRPPIFGIGVVTVFGAVVAGKVVNDRAAFF
jgi:hypothetical protein